MLRALNRTFSIYPHLHTGCPRSNFPERSSCLRCLLICKHFRLQVGKAKMCLKNIHFLVDFHFWKKIEKSKVLVKVRNFFIPERDLNLGPIQGVRLTNDLFQKPVFSSIIDLGQKFLLMSAIHGLPFYFR